MADNLQPTCEQQRDDLIKALARGELPGVDQDLYLSASHIWYRWMKGQRTRTRISNDSWVNLEHALCQDPKVYPAYSLN